MFAVQTDGEKGSERASETFSFNLNLILIENSCWEVVQVMSKVLAMERQLQGLKFRLVANFYEV